MIPAQPPNPGGQASGEQIFRIRCEIRLTFDVKLAGRRGKMQLTQLSLTRKYPIAKQASTTVDSSTTTQSYRIRVTYDHECIHTLKDFRITFIYRNRLSSLWKEIEKTDNFPGFIDDLGLFDHRP